MSDALDNPWTRNAPNASWNEPDPPLWWDIYIGAMADIGREPGSPTTKSEAIREIRDIADVMNDALGCM